MIHPKTTSGSRLGLPVFVGGWAFNEGGLFETGKDEDGTYIRL